MAYSTHGQGHGAMVQSPGPMTANTTPGTPYTPFSLSGRKGAKEKEKDKEREREGPTTAQMLFGVGVVAKDSKDSQRERGREKPPPSAQLLFGVTSATKRSATSPTRGAGSSRQAAVMGGGSLKGRDRGMSLPLSRPSLGGVGVQMDGHGTPGGFPILQHQQSHTTASVVGGAPTSSSATSSREKDKEKSTSKTKTKTSLFSLMKVGDSSGGGVSSGGSAEVREKETSYEAWIQRGFEPRFS
jgi:hypothetical protein